MLAHALLTGFVRRKAAYLFLVIMKSMVRTVCGCLFGRLMWQFNSVCFWCYLPVGPSLGYCLAAVVQPQFDAVSEHIIPSVFHQEVDLVSILQSRLVVLGLAQNVRHSATRRRECWKYTLYHQRTYIICRLSICSTMKQPSQSLLRTRVVDLLEKQVITIS